MTLYTNIKQIPLEAFKQKALLVLVLFFLSSNIFSQEINISQVRLNGLGENSFGPFVYKNELYFCYDRKDKVTKTLINDEGIQVLDLYKVKLKKENKFNGRPIRLSDTLNTLLNEGPLFITKDESKLYYSRNINIPQRISRRIQEENKLGIYISDNVEGEWQEPVAFDHNSTKFNVAHPTLNDAGDLMIFSSDDPKGFGGSDLYYSELKNGEWSKPVNLGEVINSDQSESFPQLIGNQLFFSSNREGGFGGLDIYVAPYNKGQWGEPKLLQEPINSKGDDFGYYLNEDGVSGYFSSNRRTAIDRIFYFKEELPVPSQYEEQEVYFCYDITDEEMEASDALKFKWDLGDGTQKEGLSIEHCYQDTGQFMVSMSIEDVTIGEVYEDVTQYLIEISTGGKPMIEHEVIGDKVRIKLIDKWADKSWDQHYWLINDQLFRGNFIEIAHKEELKVQLIVWNSKLDGSVIGIERTIPLER